MFVILVRDDSRASSARLKVEVGSEVKLYCDSAGNTQWYDNYLGNEIISNGNELVISDVQQDIVHHYYCFGLFTDKFDFFIARIILKVSGKW